MGDTKRTAGIVANVKESRLARPGNLSAEKHGGAGALNRIRDGGQFTGIALETEKQVRAELAEIGPSGMVEQQAIRLQTVAACYYAAILACKDVDEMGALIKVWGWVANSALRAWLQVAADQKAAARGGVSIVDVMNSLKGGDHGEGE